MTQLKSAPDGFEKLRELLGQLNTGEWRIVSDLPCYAIANGAYKIVQTPNQNNYQRYGSSEVHLGIESAQVAALIVEAVNQSQALLDRVGELEKALKEIAESDFAPFRIQNHASAALNSSKEAE